MSDNNHMNYFISWKQLPFLDITFNIIIKIIPEIIKSKFKLEKWGFVISNYDNYLHIEKLSSPIIYCKTSDKPFTKDVMRVLIIMFEYNVVENLSISRNDMTWFLEALDEVNKIHPLLSYDVQKEYFIKLNLK